LLILLQQNAHQASAPSRMLLSHLHYLLKDGSGEGDFLGRATSVVGNQSGLPPLDKAAHQMTDGALTKL